MRSCQASELAPLAAVRFGELSLEAGLPPGLVNVVPAGAEGRRYPGPPPGIGKIHFTGVARPTPRKVITAAATPDAGGHRTGRKSANIVFGDADLQTDGDPVRHQAH